MSNSGLTPYQDEVLTILMEECGETVQEICKILRFGLTEDSHHILGRDHLGCLEQEIGDILAMMKLLIDSDIGLSLDGIEAAAEAKLIKVKQWMKYNPSDSIKEIAPVPKHNLRRRKKPTTNKEVEKWKGENL